jgi:hypothetical protein
MEIEQKRYFEFQLPTDDEASKKEQLVREIIQRQYNRLFDKFLEP